MQLREIKQHHLPAILYIAALFLMDSFAYYNAYMITENNTLSQVTLAFPWRVYFIVIWIIYLFKSYNPSPRISRWNEAKIIIQSIYITGIVYTCGKILMQDISIEQTQYNLLFLNSPRRELSNAFFRVKIEFILT